MLQRVSCGTRDRPPVTVFSAITALPLSQPHLVTSSSYPAAYFPEKNEDHSSQPPAAPPNLEDIAKFKKHVTAARLLTEPGSVF